MLTRLDMQEDSSASGEGSILHFLILFMNLVSGSNQLVLAGG